MNIYLNNSVFQKAVQTLARVASTRSSIHALSGIRFLVKDGKLTLQATDLELSIETAVVVEKVEGDGDFVLPAKLLSDICRSLGQGSVSISWSEAEGAVKLKSGKADFRLKYMASEDFPKIPELELEKAVSLPLEVLIETVSWVARSASHDETRPILTTVQVVVEGDRLRMVATDSYRLSVKETKLEKPVSAKFEANIPARALQELARLDFQEGSGVSIAKQDGQVIFNFDGFKFSSRLFDGQFPDYAQLIPESFDYEVDLNGAELLDVVRRIGLLAQKNTPLKLAFSKGQIELSAQSTELGQATETIEVPYQGEPLEIGFNPEFFRDGLDGIRSDDVRLKLISALRPVLVQPVEENGYICLVMPVRLNG